MPLYRSFARFQLEKETNSAIYRLWLILQSLTKSRRSSKLSLPSKVVIYRRRQVRSDVFVDFPHRPCLRFPCHFASVSLTPLLCTLLYALRNRLALLASKVFVSSFVIVHKFVEMIKSPVVTSHSFTDFSRGSETYLSLLYLLE